MTNDLDDKQVLLHVEETIIRQLSEGKAASEPLQSERWRGEAEGTDGD